MDRLLGFIFALASIAMCAMVILYILVLAPGVPEGDWLSKTDYLRSNWTLYSAHWRIEFLAVAMTAFAAFYFARRDSMWLLVAVGHVFYLVEYPLMISGYLEAGTEADFAVLNEIAIFVFTAANMLWLLGMTGVYFRENGWLRIVGTSLAAIGALAFMAMFFGLIGMAQAAIGGLAAVILYLLNAWYGFTILGKKVELPA